MIIAVVGSRNLEISDFDRYLPDTVSEIISGGAKGIDSCVERYARERGIPVVIFYPEYSRYGKSAPLKRNLQIVDYADMIIAFWDGKSRGTKYVIDECRKKGKDITVYVHE